MSIYVTGFQSPEMRAGTHIRVVVRQGRTMRVRTGRIWRNNAAVRGAPQTLDPLAASYCTQQ